MLLCFTAVAALHLETFTATYGPFDSSYRKIFSFEGSATIDNNALILTPNSGYQKGLTPWPTRNLYGRVRLDKQFMLWEHDYNKTSRVASFNSSFLFSYYPLGRNTSPGEGLAFILVPFWNRAQSSSYGPYLGLTGIGIDGSSYHRLLAIEFDNVKQEFDPDANHVGLNINSIRSNVTASLTPLGIELAPEGQARFYNVWVQYDGVNKVIEVYIARQAELEGETPSRPDTPVLKSNLDLREVLNQRSYFGFSASTGGLNAQLNCIFRWNLTVEYYSEDAPVPEDKHPPQKKNILLEVGIGVPLLVIGVAVTGYYHLRKKQSMVPLKSDTLLGALKRLPETPREFQFKDLKMATNNFDEKNKLGQGGFGVVYRGYLPKENLILDAVEERLGDEYVVEEAKKVLVLALACSHPIASERPKTQAIVQIISGLVPVPYVPPFKPALVWPMSSVEEDDISSLVSTSETRSFLTAQLGSGFTAQYISQELFANDNFKSV
ncbi:hypothetical protein RHGRI_022527 [Rhododendron griersonianum]|uniref:Legume lectin domain-containing protein n=1 Tax=Rhododendron griersonianum TaxID=479676 RepID=A0AAV6J140_9ERIC|nr:hypothetical protein RHGRI_022527 [Rhododendron griersonianum]